MHARTAVLGASLALLCGLGFLTVRVALREGIDILVLASLALLALLGVGVIGALATPPSDD